MLTLDDAQRISAAARAAALEHGWTMVIAVVDDGGHLITLERMDGTQKGPVRVAEQKARTAMLFKRPTRRLTVSAPSLNCRPATPDGETIPGVPSRVMPMKATLTPEKVMTR